MTPAPPGPPAVLLLDVMGTLVYDPFAVEVPAFFGLSLDELWAAKQPGTWEAFERGELGEGDLETRYFRERTCDVAGLKATLSGAYRWLEGIEPLLAELADRGVVMHALSNYPAWYSLIEERLELGRYVAPSFLSFETGVRKPDPQAYLGAARALGVAPEACLFVDDREGNCEGALRVGMRAARSRGAAELRAALAAAGVSVDPAAR